MAADGIQDDHAEQQQSEHHQRSPALAVTVGACIHHLGHGDQNRDCEHRSTKL